MNIITSHFGEIVAPFTFYVLTNSRSLTPAFLVAMLSTLPQIIFPLLISADGMPEGAASAAKPTMGSRCRSVYDGLRYILGHPLLPGLYALDWGMTAVSYYRELFPLFVAELFTGGRLGLNKQDPYARFRQKVAHRLSDTDRSLAKTRDGCVPALKALPATLKGMPQKAQEGG